ncbi:unnamed protein product [marine sediment metagenome]|uniref:Uncharacterized protein n=1 Tax=marine sediment metagenome TaxID=412755 RepID=X1S5A9_9ZZZZ
METENNKIPPKQICTMRIMFPVVTDEQAIELKRKVSLALVEIPEAKIEFTLSNLSR